MNHILAPAAYGAHAAALRAADAADVGEAEIRRAIEQASPAIRHIVQRLPARAPTKGRLGALFHQLDATLRL